MAIQNLSWRDRLNLAYIAGAVQTRNRLQRNNFGAAATPNNTLQNGFSGFGFPSWGSPSFYFMPAASSFYMNQLLGLANGSAVNINFGPPSPTLGISPFLLGAPFGR